MSKSTRIVSALFVITLLFASACAKSDSEKDNSQGSPGFAAPSGSIRGDIVTSSTLLNVSQKDINILLLAYGLPAVSSGRSLTVYKIVYITEDPGGAMIQGSGALVVPGGGGSMPIVSVSHGTMTNNSDAPSLLGEKILEALWPAVNGYIAVIADYTGFGASSGIMHPYLHARSLASASLDMLRASNAFLLSIGQATNGKIFNMGYSEGGYAAMALQKDIEQNRSDEITLTASALGAGPYDLSGSGAEKIESETIPGVAYFVYVIVAYNETYRWGRGYNEIFKEPYASSLPGVYNGSQDIEQIGSQLTSVTADLLQPGFIADYKGDGERTLKNALVENNLLNWAPKTPTRLIHGINDQIVPYQNSVTARDSFAANGAGVELVPCTQGAGDHGDCYLPFIYSAVGWFDRF
ncbi:Lysophospholipase [hydrothermal vent metagenome]|uniref:Lysophospholipase n=1 Tax=hydrothermal vent metagenome TaxID=652676 RepID=A0A3B1BWJ5_9ZZZZ